MDLELVNHDEISHTVMCRQYLVYSKNNWEFLDKINNEFKTFILDDMLKYFTEIKDDEKCVEINKRLINK